MVGTNQCWYLEHDASMSANVRYVVVFDQALWNSLTFHACLRVDDSEIVTNVQTKASSKFGCIAQLLFADYESVGHEVDAVGGFDDDALDDKV